MIRVVPGSRSATVVAAVLAAVLGGTVTGCTTAGPTPSDPDPTTTAPTTGPTTGTSPTSPAASGPASASAPASRPTVAPSSAATLDALPPPPAPSAPAPSTAGRLKASSLPRPAGWTPVARAGGTEQGYEGNGTFVHAKDPRYAARDLITIGCTAVSRSQYTDPTAALEGTYDRDGAPGIGLALQFGDADQAQAFFDLYLNQVRACTDPDGPVLARRLGAPLSSGTTLVDRRTYPDGRWTEIAAVDDDQVSFVILNDDHSTSRPAAATILRQIS